jgi:hypothetical protein
VAGPRTDPPLDPIGKSSEDLSACLFVPEAKMLLQSLLSGVALAGLVAAQTPSGFTPEVKDRLDLIFGTKVITVPGTALTRAGKNPEIHQSLPSSNPPQRRRDNRSSGRQTPSSMARTSG